MKRLFVSLSLFAGFFFALLCSVGYSHAVYEVFAEPLRKLAAVFVGVA
ncbi:MAG TPA: hypothetical protein VJO99_07070 [Burkholderiaceae bacterium]|nr:hypothetical protein [Burkholderiaceae bacterium]